MNFTRLALISLSILIIESCKPVILDKPIITDFSKAPTVTPVLPIINETSGIAESKTNLGYLWVNEDSGTPASLTLVSKQSGQTLKKLPIKGAKNRDWEDMCLSGTDIYIADIGDNKLSYPSYNIYFFPEPAANATTVNTFSKINFTYSDGKHDAEAFLVDPKTKDIYIITKNDAQSGIYKLIYPYSLTNLNTARAVGKLKYTGVVSAAISADAKEILVKTYTNVQLYNCKPDQSIAEALTNESRNLNYVLEPQGEAITFSNDNKYIYTLSEKGLSTAVSIYCYTRK